MQIDHAVRDGCTVVRFTGHITLFTAPEIQRVLLKDLSHRPYAIICDLGGVETLDPVCATVFATVANHPSTHWPTTKFLLCGASPPIVELLGRLGMPRFLPLCDTVEQALDQVAARPPFLRDELRLAPTAFAPAAARVFVNDVLEYWRLALPSPEVTGQAELLAGELVANAVTHAGTEVRLRLELRGDRLRIAVFDASPRLRLVPDNPEREGDRGLRLVERLATAWGIHQRPGGGKVVWCTLRL